MLNKIDNKYFFKNLTEIPVWKLSETIAKCK